ncbi:hypothetical protein V9T40_002541 [Parthenolecanium corni]|uniref:CRAL-TRIO domain-containing protein n=1 Tax=Parthenolecanium corni TaxID=536013 RepID=A0AAN9Y5P9_9HEMI
MDNEEMVKTDDQKSLDTPAESCVEKLVKCKNTIADVSDNPLKAENSKNKDEPVIISNGSINKFNSRVDEIVNDLQHSNINLPSTSGLASTSHCVEQSKNAIMNAKESDNEEVSLHVTPQSSNHYDSTSQYRPSTLPLEKTKRRVLKISPEEISSPDSPMSEEENKFISPETDSQDELENSIMVILNNSQESSDMIPELTFGEEQAELRNWKACTIAGVKRQIDLKVIEPYKRVLSHGGYLNTGSHNAIITFSACFLPHKSRKDYNYVMDNLFFYILHTLNQLVTDDYVLVYLHGGTTKDCIPTFSWLKRCYQMIDRKLKKNLKALYLVHPTFWLRTLVTMIKPFISSKFSRKINFVNSLTELGVILPIEEASIPEKVRQYDRIKMSLLKK